MIKIDDKGREAILEALGTASLCWSEPPTGQFDSNQAIEVAERLMKRLEGGQAQGQIDELAAFILAEVDGEPSRSEGAVDTAIRVLRDALDIAGNEDNDG